MSPEVLPAAVDVVRLVWGVCGIAFGFFVAGVIIGRRLAPGSPTHLDAVHRSLQINLAAAFTCLEELMVTQSQRLIDEMASVGSKLDGYVAIINASNTFSAGLLEQLKAMQGDTGPTKEQVDDAIKGLEGHLAGVGTALTNLAAIGVPPAPTASWSPPAVPAPAPVAEVVAAAQVAATPADAPVQAQAASS